MATFLADAPVALKRGRLGQVLRANGPEHLRRELPRSGGASPFPLAAASGGAALQWWRQRRAYQVRHSSGSRLASANAADSAAVVQLETSARDFTDLREQWQAMNGVTDQSLLQQLMAKEQELKNALKAAPFGDPTETTTVPRHHCADAVVAAHGSVTQAAIEAELARCCWEVKQLSQSQDQTSLASALINAAVLRLRMFDIDGAYEDLQKATTLETSDPRLDLLTRYSAQLKAPRHPNFMTGEEVNIGPGEALLSEVRAIFLANEYKTDMVLQATKASSMSEFIFVESRADKLEQGLLESVEEPNPMKPEVEGRRVPVDLVDLIRIFLLHRVLPLARLCQLFGPQCTQLLLKLRAITALAGNECRIVEPEEACAAIDHNSYSCGALYVMSNVAIWPLEEDLLIATDFEQTFSSEGLEPVMYISEDSLALVCGAPRQPAVSSVLDLCCGSGVQGIVAMRNYAASATFVDLNPRSPPFVRFNLALNNMSAMAAGIYEGSLYEALPPGAGPFGAIVANPPFVPNPEGIASGAGAMFGNGGDTGERVLAGIIQGAPTYLAPGGRLSFVAMTPNVEELPGRLEGWLSNSSGCEALIFRGVATPAERYLPTGSSVETTRYQSALQRLGITTLSEAVGVLAMKGTTVEARIAGEPRNELWADHAFLRTVVQQSALADGEASPSLAEQAPKAAPTPPPPVAKAPPASPPPPVTKDPSTDPFAAASNAAAAVSAAATTAATPNEGEADKQAREGILPGFQPGFFPGYCRGPSPAWAATAQELEELFEAAAR